MYAGDFIVKDYIEERAVEIAGYIIETKATVRQTAKQFGISKSTVHMVVIKKNCIEILYIWLNDKRERTINLDVYSFFFFRKILIVNIQNAMFI
jgi:putative DeoR family transcriptional regulator (stage III sporulation protein D)